MDLMIKIKTYVYTYVGLFSSKLQLINSRIQLSWVNRDIFSRACRICLLFTIPNFWRTIFTVTKRNSHVDTAPRSIFPIQILNAVQVREMGLTTICLVTITTRSQIWFGTSLRHKDEHARSTKMCLSFLNICLFFFLTSVDLLLLDLLFHWVSSHNTIKSQQQLEIKP